MICEQLGIQYPIFQAGMAGGLTTPELVAAVSNFGAFGNIGAGYMSPEELREAVKQTKKLTNKPFGVNVFIPEPKTSLKVEDIERMISFLNQNAPESPIPSDWSFSDKGKVTFEGQLEIILSEGIRLCSFTFGLPDRMLIKELQRSGVRVMGTATTVEEAIQLASNGVDMIVAQGCEAGGHRGTFPTTQGNPQIGLLALVQQMVHSVKIPVIAAGGIVTTGGIKAVLSLGAAGAQLGTAFLTCKESGANRAYRNKIIESKEEDVIMTKAFSGKWARGIRNEFIEEMEKASLDIPPYPIQNELTKYMRSHAAKKLNPEKLSLWAGQGVGMIQREYSVSEILEELVSDLNIK